MGKFRGWLLLLSLDGKLWNRVRDGHVCHELKSKVKCNHCPLTLEKIKQCTLSIDQERKVNIYKEEASGKESRKGPRAQLLKKHKLEE